METVKIETLVPKETQEFCDGVATLVIETKKEIDDNGGWAIGDDLPGVSVAVMKFLPALNGASAMKAELEVDPAGFLAAWAIAGGKVVAALLAK